MKKKVKPVRLEDVLEELVYIAQEEDSASAWLNLATAFAKLNQHNAAIRCYDIFKNKKRI